MSMEFSRTVKKIYDKSHGCVSKEFNDKDFTAIKRFKANGIPVVSLTGDTFNRGMCLERKVPYYDAKGIDNGLDKAKALPIICDKYNVSKEDVAYVGDDFYDLSILKLVGHPFCPLDAIREVKCVSTNLWVNGGDGVVVSLFSYCVDNGLIKDFQDKYPDDNL